MIERRKPDTDIALLKQETKAQTKILTEVCRTVKKIERDQNAHALADEKRFGQHNEKISKLETDIAWTRRVGSFIIAGLSGWFHFKGK